MLLCGGIIVVAGCTSQAPAPQVNATVPPENSVPATTNATPVITPTTVPTTRATVAIVKTIPVPEADATDPGRIKFVRYTDSDFSIDIPQAWNSNRSTYTPYFCTNTLEPGSSAYKICYRNETRRVGPFNFYDDDTLKKERRIVTFTSADGKIKMVAFTADFFDGLNGMVTINPTNEWSQKQFELNYPDMTGYAPTYVGNYQFFASGNALTSLYDVTMTRETKYYPVAYTKKSVITPHHVYTFAWIRDGDNFVKYDNLKDFQLASITINNA